MENAKMQYLVTNFQEKAWNKYETLNWMIWDKAEELMEGLFSLDPTGERLIYGKWIVTLFIKKAGNDEGCLLVEDLDRITAVLTTFERLKPHLQEKDINKYKSLQDLYIAFEPFEEKTVVSKREEKRNKKDAIWAQIDEVYDDKNISVYVPKTFEASQFLGLGTKWCTTTSDGTFKSYGLLHIIFIKDQADKSGHQLKFQFSLSHGQFMDFQDRAIDLEVLVKQHPSIRKFFSQHITMSELVRNKRCFALSRWDSPNDFTPEQKVQYAIMADLKSLANYVNKPDFTPAMMMEVCEGNGNALEYLVKDKRLTSEMISAALIKTPDALKHVRKDKRLDGKCQLAAIKANMGNVALLAENPTLPDEAIRYVMKHNAMWMHTVIDKRMNKGFPIPADIIKYARDHEWID